MTTTTPSATKLKLDIQRFLQNTSFVAQFQFLIIAKSHKDIINITFGDSYHYNIFRITKHIFSISRSNQYYSEYALIECSEHTFSFDQYFVTYRNVT